MLKLAVNQMLGELNVRNVRCRYKLLLSQSELDIYEQTPERLSIHWRSAYDCVVNLYTEQKATVAGGYNHHVTLCQHVACVPKKVRPYDVGLFVRTGLIKP